MLKDIRGGELYDRCPIIFDRQDARGSEPMDRDESEGPMTQTSLEVKSVFDSITVECAASVAGSILPSSDGTIYTGFKARAAAGVIS